MRRNPPIVVIVSQDWQSRALLRAELIEAGFRARAYLSAADASAAIEGGGWRPALIVVDISWTASETGREALSALAQRAPVWAIASRADEGKGNYGFESVFFRPVKLGDVVARIARRLRGGE